jgi:sporulation protein YunB
LRHRRRIGRRRLKVKYKLILILAVILGLILFIDCQLRPLVRALSVNQAKTISNKVINQVVLEEMTQEQVTYKDLVNIERGSDGKILAIGANSIRMNELKAAVSLHSQERIGEIMDETLQIPIGTLIDSEFTRGRGPKLPLHLSLSGNVQTEFTSKFESAGINQTRHQIYLTVHTSIFAIIPGYYNSSTEVETSVIVAETVIVGEVPEVYAGLTADNATDIADLARLRGQTGS